MDVAIFKYRNDALIILKRTQKEDIHKEHTQVFQDL